MRTIFYNILNIFSGITRTLFKKNLRVLAYHDVPNTNIFSEHIRYLKSHYNIIDITTLKESINYSKKLPDYPLLITFDDGYRSALENALPVLKKNKVSSCIFIITGYINSSNSFWWNNVKENKKKNGISSLDIRKQINRLKEIDNRERLEILEKFSTIEQKQLSTKDLRYMKQNKMFIGNHTHSHPMLDKCTETEIQNELKYSKKSFDKWDIEGFDIFAYPNGNQNKLTEELLKKNHIKLAFLFDHKLNPSKISPLRISRIRTNADMSLSELKVKVSGLHSLISNLR